MELTPCAIEEIVRRVIAQAGKAESAAAPAPAQDEIPVGVSNRHIHLSREHLEVLFGKGYELTPIKDLSQPGQYACKEVLTIVGPSMRAIESVRVLGPLRRQTQVEISRTDSFTLKVKPPVRESGSLNGSAAVTIVGPKGVVALTEGCIIANRHIHLSEEDGRRLRLNDGDVVTVDAAGERKTRFYDVQVRVSPDFRMEMHLDTDDANAAGIGNGAKARIVKE